MKLVYFLFLIPFFAIAQTKKIDFFGTEFLVNNNCVYKPGDGLGSLKYEKNALIWTDAPQKLIRGTMISMMKKAITGKKAKEIKSEDIKVKLLKQSWSGKMSQYKKTGNDTITNFITLFGDYKNTEKMIIIGYKTISQEPFRIPTYFDFLIK